MKQSKKILFKNNMKQYKLKKWYPSLCEVWVTGDIVIPWEKQKDYYHVPNKTGIIYKKEVENNPDFWELIEEKEPLFITEDGVEVSNRIDWITFVNPSFEKSKGFAKNFRNLEATTKVFYHERNADEYIWRNNPVFSYEDFIRWGNVPYQRVIEQLAKERSNNEF